MSFALQLLIFRRSRKTNWRVGGGSVEKKKAETHIQTNKQRSPLTKVLYKRGSSDCPRLHKHLDRILRICVYGVGREGREGSRSEGYKARDQEGPGLRTCLHANEGKEMPAQTCTTLTIILFFFSYGRFALKTLVRCGEKATGAQVSETKSRTVGDTSPLRILSLLYRQRDRKHTRSPKRGKKKDAEDLTKAAKRKKSNDKKSTKTLERELPQN